MVPVNCSMVEVRMSRTLSCSSSTPCFHHHQESSMLYDRLHFSQAQAAVVTGGSHPSRWFHSLQLTLGEFFLRHPAPLSLHAVMERRAFGLRWTTCSSCLHRHLHSASLTARLVTTTHRPRPPSRSPCLARCPTPRRRLSPQHHFRCHYRCHLPTAVQVQEVISEASPGVTTTSHRSMHQCYRLVQLLFSADPTTGSSVEFSLRILIPFCGDAHRPCDTSRDKKSDVVRLMSAYTHHASGTAFHHGTSASGRHIPVLRQACSSFGYLSVFPFVVFFVYFSERVLGFYFWILHTTGLVALH